MIIIRNKILPLGRRYAAVNLFGILFVKTEVTGELINHEAIHTAQMKELFFIGFFLCYVFEWLSLLPRCRFNAHTAYRRISFEREAYAYQDYDRYLSVRRCFAQWR